MKVMKYLCVVAAIASALTLSAKADLMFLGAIPFTDGGNNSPDTNHDVLVTFLGFDPGPLNDNHNYESGLDGAVDVFPNEYFVVHYGKGKGGTSKGGSLEFFKVITGKPA